MNESKQPGGKAPAGEILAPILPEESRDAAVFAPMDDIAAPREALPSPGEESAPPAAPGIGAAGTDAAPPFSATRAEMLAALACYILGRVYWEIFSEPLWLAAFVLGFVALTEWIYRNEPRARESWVWLGCVAVLTAALVFDRCHAWRDEFDNVDAIWYFLHIFSVWWVLSRGGRLAELDSGHLLPYDALNAFIVFPFKHFFLRIRCLWYALTRIGRGEKRLGATKLLWSLGASLAALLLLLRAAKLLTAADSAFDSFLTRFGDWLRLDESDRLQFFLSLPVGAYIFGLVAGSAREDAAAIRARGARLMNWLSTLRKVPNAVFAAALAVFAVFYLAFFALQGSYLFGAFTRTLPEGFVVAEYARQGFFELCRVMAVNFALLWLVARTAGKPLRESRPLLVGALALLAESLLFAVIAASKLWLYIDCFGFTPKRLQSAWLIGVLAAGCLCALYSILTGKKSFRGWMVYGAVSLSLLCLY